MFRSRSIAAVAALAATLAGADVAQAQWSAPRTVSAPHTFIGPLILRDGPFAAFGWQDGTDPARGQGASTVGPDGEQRAPAGLLDVQRSFSSGVVGLVQRQVTSGDRRRQTIGVALGTTEDGLGPVRTLRTARIVGLAKLSVAPDGRAVVGWIEASGARRIVRVAYRPSGRFFGGPTTISGRGQADTVTVAVGQGADIVAAFERNGRLLARTRPRGGRWRPIEELARADGQTQWQLAAAITPGGQTQVAWRRSQKRTADEPARRVVEASSASRGRRFARAQTLSENGALGDPQLQITHEGFAVAYALTPDASSTARAQVHLRPFDGRFGPPLIASPLRGGLRDVALASDRRTRRMAVGWVLPTPSGNGGGRAQAALRPFGGTFGDPEDVTPDEAVDELELIAGPDRGFTAAWTARPEGAGGPGTPIAQIRTVVRTATRR